MRKGNHDILQKSKKDLLDHQYYNALEQVLQIHQSFRQELEMLVSFAYHKTF